MNILKLHTLNMIDWVDYRTNPHWWPFVALPAALVTMSAFLPAVMQPVLIGIALVGTFLVGLLAACLLLVLIAGRTIRDLWIYRRSMTPAAQTTIRLNHVGSR